MPKVVKIRLDGGEEIDAIEQDFSIKREEWNEYELADGGRVRVKTTVAKILRVIDSEGKPVIAEDGEPRYIIRHSTQITAS